MRKLSAIMVIFLSYAFTAPAISETDNRTPETKYEAIVSYSSVMCNFAFIGDNAEGTNNLRNCIDTGKIEIKKEYDNLSSKVKKSSAKAALKEHYIASIAALQGIRPQSEERRINYDKRQGDAKNRLDELWVRFQVEK
jgi:hypothetical protein